MAEPKDPSIPIRIPPELLEQIDTVALKTQLSKQDIMRLAMRIGLVDLRAAEHDIPGIVKRIADDKGVSFEAFAKAAAPKREEENAPELRPITGRQEIKYDGKLPRHLTHHSGLNEKETGD